MKTLLSITTILALLWALQLKFQEIPKIQASYEAQSGKIEELEKEKAKELSLLTNQIEDLTSKLESAQKTNLDLANQLKEQSKEKVQELPVTIVQTEKPKEDYSGHNSAIMSKITRLTDEKRLEKEKLDVNVRQIEEYLAKGQTLLNEHLKVKPEFKDGNIKTSEADRQKWYEQHKIRETVLRTEISKLEGQKENLTRAYNSIAAKIDLEIQKLEKEIK